MVLELEREGDSGVCVLRLDGELDVARIPAVRDALKPAIEEECDKLVLDLSDVTYADSSALGLLVWLSDRIGRHEGKIVLVGANADVSRVLELSGLLSLAPTFSASPNLNAALEGLELPEVPAEALWHKDFSMSASVGELAGARGRVVEVLKSVGLPDSAMYDVKVAAGEALANAMLHGSPRGPEDRIRVDITAYPDRVTIAVTDCGDHEDATFEGAGDDRAPSGRGLTVMRAFLDKVDVAKSSEGGTTVTLVKHLRLS
jgi:anti-anti-sigma factor